MFVRVPPEKLAGLLSKMGVKPKAPGGGSLPDNGKMKLAVVNMLR